MTQTVPTHSWFPIFSGFVLYRERSRQCGFAPRPSAWGLPLLDLALGVLVVGVLGAELFLSRLSLLLVVAGQVSYLLGGGDFHSFLLSLAALSLLHLAPGVVRRAWEARRECAFIQDFLSLPSCRVVLPLFSTSVVTMRCFCREQALDSLRYQSGVWQGLDVPIASDVRDVLGQGGFCCAQVPRCFLRFVQRRHVRGIFLQAARR